MVTLERFSLWDQLGSVVDFFNPDFIFYWVILGAIMRCQLGVFCDCRLKVFFLGILFYE
jgi:hypothetical protein